MVPPYTQGAVILISGDMQHFTIKISRLNAGMCFYIKMYVYSLVMNINFPRMY